MIFTYIYIFIITTFTMRIRLKERVERQVILGDEEFIYIRVQHVYLVGAQSERRVRMGR